MGEKVAESNRESQDIIIAEFDLDAMQTARSTWGLFRDRRPDLYGGLLNLDGATAES